MRRALLLISGLVAALVWASPGTASPDTRVATVELVRYGAGLYVPRSPVSTFTLVGVQWRGSGNVLFRTRSLDGHWSPWRRGAPEAEDGPDIGSSEPRTPGWRIGNPWWVGSSDRVQVRLVGRVTAVRARLVWSPEVRIPYRRPALTGTPSIVPRIAWGANESIRRAAPTYAPAVGFAVVHHTAGSSSYSRSEAPAVVRGIQLYHVQGNGWNDIGYNFLVDRFGTIYEGRYGGIDRNVVGAHAQGFNTGSVGIAVLGTYGSSAPPRVAQDAVARLIAWRLDLAHVDPVGFTGAVSSGSDRYPSGVPVLVSTVAGHRDTGLTECPGSALYARLGAIAASARAIGGQKVFDPRAEVTASHVRLQARFLRPGPWLVTIVDADAVEAARGSGTGGILDWTWDSSSAQAGTYTWSIEAGDARPASGSVRAGQGAVPLEIETAAVEPETISPNGDGQADSATLTYTLSSPANVTVAVTDASGAVVSTVIDRVWTRAGTRSAVVAGETLSDGRYTVVLTARSPTGATVESFLPLGVSRTLGAVEVTPTTFSPNGDGRKDRLTVSFSLTGPADVRLRIEREGRWVATPLTASLPAGSQAFVWDGTRSAGPLRDGDYDAIVEAVDVVGAISFGRPFVSDTTAPRVRVLPGRRVRIEVSEPSTLTLRIDGRPVRREVPRAGVVGIPRSGGATRIRVVAWDAAGNSSGPVVRVQRTRGNGSGQ
jgi:hypothetical protein